MLILIIDIEIYNLHPTKLISILNNIGSINLIGKQFSIFKTTIHTNNDQQTFDISLPRIDNKTSAGHKGFLSIYKSTLTFREASIRRDFTINSIGYDLKFKRFIDPYNGIKNIKYNILKHTSISFKEDPLRILRACQFAARFQFKIHHKTLQICKLIKKELFTISTERIFEEFKKIILSPNPSIGLSLLKETNAIILFPELKLLITNYSNKYLWNHLLSTTNHITHVIYKYNIPHKEALTLLLGAICHFLYKQQIPCTKNNIINKIHDNTIYLNTTTSFLKRIGAPYKIIHDIIMLTQYYRLPHDIYHSYTQISNKTLHYLCMKIPIKRLYYISKINMVAHKVQQNTNNHILSSWFLIKVIKQLINKNLLFPIIIGKHLIIINMKPGKQMGSLLKQLFTSQLYGNFYHLIDSLIWLQKELLKN